MVHAGLSCFQENLSGVILMNIFNSNALAADWSPEARNVHPCGLYYDVSVQQQFHTGSQFCRFKSYSKLLYGSV